MSDPWQGPVADQWEPAHVLDSELVHQGGKWNVVVETASIGGHHVRRDIVVHPGAVAVVVLNDMNQVYLLRQYRQPLGAFLFETPAGLLDDPSEQPLAAAQRELAEEAGLKAKKWHVLVDFLNSPGGTSEAIRVYLATDITEIVGGRQHTGEAEEIDLPGVWLDLNSAVDSILDGSLGNPTTVVGVLAAEAARAAGWRHLRDASSPWRARENLWSIGRLPVGQITDPSAVV
jgi:ADP-ribose pyrophosphatase